MMSNHACDDHGQGLVDEKLRLLAESEMRRALPGLERPNKRAKPELEEIRNTHLERFDASCLNEIADGAVCVFGTCDFRREISAVKEAVMLATRHHAQTTTKNTDVSIKLSSLKLSTRGAVLLRLQPLPNEPSVDTARRAFHIISSIYKEHSQSPTIHGTRYIRRILPLASTCAATTESLRVCATRIAPLVVDQFTCHEKDAGYNTGNNNTFAIAVYNRLDPNAINNNSNQPRNESAQQQSPSTWSRQDIIAAVAGGLTDALRDVYNMHNVSVDLKSPRVVIIVETMSCMGRSFAGIGVLPAYMCALKPRLGLKSLQIIPDKGGGER